MRPELAASKAIQTPFMRQWFAAKERYPDALIFFRMGDFYELFLDDAVRASRLLGLTLTSRNKGEPDEIPMAGAPHHNAHTYVARALSHGLSVAICEQMADPAKCKGIVPREVVRVITPGLVVDDHSLDARINHWLVAVERMDDGGAVGLAALDHSTGELLGCALSDTTSALAEIARLEPREVLLGPRAHDLVEAVTAVAPRTAIRREGAAVDDTDALRVLGDHLGPAEAANATREASAITRRAVARALGYAQSMTPGVRVKVSRLLAYDPVDTLQLDESTATHLELTRGADGDAATTLLTQLDATRTPAGARLLRRWILAPLAEVAAIRRRHDAVELFLLDAPLREAFRARLAEVGDLERLATRAALGQASPRDLGALRDGIGALPAIASILGSSRDPSAREILGLDRPLDLLDDVHAQLSRALQPSPPANARDGGVFRDGFDAVLDELAELRRSGDSVLLKLEARLREESGIPNVKLRFNKVFGWYLEVSRGNVEKVPASWRRKQTVANAERYSTDELDALQDKLLSAEDRHREREIELFDQLRAAVAAHGERLRDVAARLARWDVLAALADVAHRHDYVRPDVDDSLSMVLEESRHPVVERLAPTGGVGRFVPNDVVVSADAGGERLLVITGPNMAGKSTLMRQVALACIMAQAGSFVAARGARIGVVDRVMTRVGASDSLARGASTFMVEMREAANILRRASRRSLIVLDEIGRGTSTYDGLSIAWAVAEHIHDVIGARTLFATHYHELCELAATCPGLANYSVAAKEIGDDVVFLHRLVKGGASRSYGIAVARLAGVPEPVLARARAILATLERGATLPGGKQASMRGRARDGSVQLDIFSSGAGAGAPAEPARPHPVIETLRQVDLDRLAPIEAWQLVLKLKGLVSSS
ncbi:MAG: DNA mismatch repair protein MutS [Deltaproteobacteria bacterium]|nr:DNA mismatch repair protein MutS [Deltaproteobacteria bacterium]